MKKIMAILALVIICQAGYSQKNVNDLFKEFSKMNNVTTISMGQITMKFASLFSDTMGVDGIEVYSLEDCTNDVKEKLSKAVSQLKDNKFETMVNANENGQRTKVLVRIENEMIREMVIVTTGNDAALVRIKGKIKPSDIERMVNKHGKGES